MSDIILYIGAILSAIVAALYLFYQYQFTYWKKRNIPHLPAGFPHGTLAGVGQTICTSESFSETYHAFKGKNVIAGLYMFYNPAVLLLDPDLIKAVMVQDFNAFHSRGIYNNEDHDPLGSTLFELDGHKWKPLRSKLSPTFSSGKMKLMFNFLKSVGEELVDVLKINANTGDPVEIKDILARFTIDVIGTCAFGIDCNSLKNPNAEFCVQGKKSFDLTKTQLAKLFFSQLFPNFSQFIKLRISDFELTEFFKKVVKETVDYRKSSGTRRNDYMQLLIDLDELTFNQIVGLSFSFFSAGYETSSSTMTNCIFELAQHPEIQQKLRDEINETIEKNNGELTYDLTMSMPYLGKVINETLRKYPPGGIIARVANQNYKIPNTDYVIEKGVTAVISAYGLHNDPDIFPEPKKFDPERFNPENDSKRHPFTYLPFGDGPRICIGMRFGLMQVRLGLITILKNYKITTCSKTNLNVKFRPAAAIMLMDGGCWLKVEHV